MKSSRTAKFKSEENQVEEDEGRVMTKHFQSFYIVSQCLQSSNHQVFSFLLSIMRLRNYRRSGCFSLLVFMVHVMSLDSKPMKISPDESQAKVLASSLHAHWQAVLERTEDEGVMEGGRRGGQEEEAYGKMGSRPPSCQHKCGVCVPCAAIQVPTTNTGHLQTQYANYEPEGWKCKCGSYFYNP